MTNGHKLNKKPIDYKIIDFETVKYFCKTFNFANKFLQKIDTVASVCPNFWNKSHPRTKQKIAQKIVMLGFLFFCQKIYSYLQPLKLFVLA